MIRCAWCRHRRRDDSSFITNQDGSKQCKDGPSCVARRMRRKMLAMAPIDPSTWAVNDSLGLGRARRRTSGRLIAHTRP